MPSVRERVAAINRNHGGNIRVALPLAAPMPPPPPHFVMHQGPPPPPAPAPQNARQNNELIRDLRDQMREQREEHRVALHNLERRLVALSRHIAGCPPQQNHCTFEFAFVCPISYEIMRDPVICSDGHTYERENITQWLHNHNTSPLTNQRLANKDLIPNHALRGIIKAYYSENDTVKKSGCDV